MSEVLCHSRSEGHFYSIKTNPNIFSFFVFLDVDATFRVKQKKSDSGVIKGCHLKFIPAERERTYHSDSDIPEGRLAADIKPLHSFLSGIISLLVTAQDNISML